MRSLLFVPGDSEKKLEKALASGADVLIVDLEDSVAGSRKDAARDIAADFIRAQRKKPAAKIYVRVNDFESGMTDGDLAAVVPARPDGIMLPKCAGSADVVRLSVKLRVHEAEAGLADGSTAILPIVTESARALLMAASFTAPLPRLAGVTWGAEDLSADIGARSPRDDAGRYTGVFQMARNAALLAATAAETAAIDTVYIDFRNAAGLAAECAEAGRDGFTGKMAIHPDQVAVINQAFTPSAEAVAESRAVIEAFEAAGNPGVVGIGGRMYDRPHLRRAERLLARARAAGVPVEG